MTGFVPALGTPLDKNGNLCVESYKKQIDDQIKAGAAGILAGYWRQDALHPPAVYGYSHPELQR